MPSANLHNRFCAAQSPSCDSLPFKVALDMHTREFQYKLPNRIVFSNTNLTRFGITDSPLGTLCGKVHDETPEHFFVSCHLSMGFRQEISNWLQLCNIYNVIDFTKPVNVMFSLLDINDHFMPLNHIVILTFQLKRLFLIGQERVTCHG